MWSRQPVRREGDGAQGLMSMFPKKESLARRQYWLNLGSRRSLKQSREKFNILLGCV